MRRRPLTFRIDGGRWFDIDAVTLLSYRQTLDLRGAVLTREFRFRDEAGRTSSVTQHRFVAMHMAHVAALETTITAEDWSGTIEIRSTLDGNVRNCGVERYRDLASEHLGSLEKRALCDDSVLLTVQTTQSRIPIAVAARTTVWRGDVPVPASYRLVDEEFEIGHQITAELAAGQSLTVEKVVAMVTGRDVATSEPAVGAERRLDRQGRFAEIRHGHLLAWAHLWERLSIEFDDHADELRILRLHLLHLLQTVCYHSADLDIGVPARGLHGEAYRGHIFWDELFIFPVLNLRLPAVTRSLLGYRYHLTAPDARTGCPHRPRPHRPRPHDHVIQRLFAVGLSLQGTISRARSTDVRQRLSGDVDDLQAVIQEIRTAIFDLHGPSAGITRLRQRIDEAIAQFAGAELRTTVQIVGPLSVVDAALADHAEAVVREAVSNAVRHANATTLTVNVTVEDELCIEVIDNGRGISGDVTGSGLTNLARRAEEAGGTFTIDNLAEGGTVLRWAAPLT